VNLALFGGFDKRPLGPGWKKETLVAVLGGGEVDLTASPPDGNEGRLTAVAILGGIDITVAPGTRVALSGMGLFGGRSVKVSEGEGPMIRLKAVAIFGGVEVKER
jgi:hypothetical protein